MKISLKLKILFGVIFLLLVCTGFNLGYSYKLFVEDKTSYIFESVLNKATSISNQINLKLKDFLVKSEFNSLLITNESIDYSKLINSQDEVLLSGFIEEIEGKKAVGKNFENVDKLNKYSPEFKANIFKEINLNLNSLDFGLKTKAWIYTPEKNIRLNIYFSKKVNNKVFFMVSNLSSLLSLFEKESSYLNKIIFLNNHSEYKANQEWLNGIDYKSSKKGAIETQIKNESYLLAYSFVNEKILVISSIKKDEAFGVINFLILKTILFAFFLIGIGIIAGVIFSTSLTYPILALTSKAKKVAEGDFSGDVVVNTTDEIKILGDTFNFMSKEIKELLSNKEVLIAKLEDYSKNLEKMVEERTLELKKANDFMALMVNSLDQGLLVFDQDLQCHPMFTKACVPIFGVSPEDKNVLEVLSITDETQVQNLNQWAKVLFSEMIPFESAVSLGPRNKITGTNFNDEDYKFIQIDYYPMRDDEEKIINIVMIATDKTHEVQMTEKAKERENYVNMILKILNNKTQFESFTNEVEGIFEQFPNAYNFNESKIDFNLCMMLFHTLNGGFGIYSITKLQLMARGFESNIVEVKDTDLNIQEYILKLESQIKELRNAFFDFRVDFDKLVGTKFASNQSISEIPRSKILEFKKIIKDSHSLPLFNFYSDNFLKVPVINYFKAYDELCITTAAKINKEFEGLTFNNENLKVEAEQFLEFFNVLVHLFRNCLDHGLEDPYKRESLGKSRVGHIGVSFDEIEINSQKFLSVVIQDDGAGIDPKIIRSRCEKLNPTEDVSHLSDKEIIYQIFAPFFSTRDEVSALSGRGVGMSAIKEVVDRLNGQIEIESHVGKGTVFSFMIPTEF